jgi:uncharacterized protein
VADGEDPRSMAAELRAALERLDSGDVEERETHISWVFLVGERAYKLKKPLVLPFLDYGTVARRRQMCLEEVRLNRRLAPSIYLGVRSMVAGSSGFELSDEGDPRALDYVVEMRRYDEARTLAAELGRREVRGPEVADVGRVLAAFHADCPAMTGPEYGTQRLERGLDRNIEELLAVTENRGERRRIRALARFMNAYVDSQWCELEERARSGRVRECHGDLRAEHVVLEERLSIVDCVEFDSELRTLDVADDLAFLVMELESLGGGRLIDSLLDAYDAASGAPADHPLLAFFAVHRALVRAKVLLVRASQDPPGSAPRAGAMAEAGALVDVAETFCWRARLPLGIVCCGVPASGKSHLARAIAKRSSLSHLSSDVTRKQLAGLRSTRTAAPEHYSDEFSRTTYAELGRRAAGEIGASGGVILDATFRRRRDRDAFAEGFAGAAPLLFVECLAPAELLVERARARERDPGRVSDATVEVVMRERHGWEPLDELAALDHVALRTDRCVESVISDLEALLDERLLVRGR